MTVNECKDELWRLSLIWVWVTTVDSKIDRTVGKRVPTVSAWYGSFSSGFADAAVDPIDFPVAPAAAMPKVRNPNVVFSWFTDSFAESKMNFYSKSHVQMCALTFARVHWLPDLRMSTHRLAHVHFQIRTRALTNLRACTQIRARALTDSRACTYRFARVHLQIRALNRLDLFSCCNRRVSRRTTSPCGKLTRPSALSCWRTSRWVRWPLGGYSVTTRCVGPPDAILSRVKVGLHVRKHKHEHNPRVNRDDASTTSASKRNRNAFLCLVLASSRFGTRGFCLCLFLRRSCKPALRI